MVCIEYGGHTPYGISLGGYMLQSKSIFLFFSFLFSFLKEQNKEYKIT